MAINTWTFDTTGEAYDACQCDTNINDGDVLIIASENVVGIAYTWPFALTEERGALHTLAIPPQDFFIKEGLDLDALAIAEKFILQL